MRLDINIPKSVDKLRIIPKSKWTYYSDFIIFGIIGLIFLFLIIVSLYDKHFVFDGLTIFEIVIYITIFSMILSYIYRMDKFKVFSDNKQIISKDLFIDLANKLHWTILNDDGNTLIFQPSGTFTDDSQITIIFNNGKILINVMSFGRGGIKSPIYFLYDKFVYKDIFDNLHKVYKDIIVE